MKPGRKSLPQNNSPLNRAALACLSKAKEPPDPTYPHVLTLAMWGLEKRVEGEWPDRDRYALEQQVHLTLGWKAENLMAWLVSNPNGPEAEEQEEWLARDLRREVHRPEVAAGILLGAIYSRMQSQLPALQTA